MKNLLFKLKILRFMLSEAYEQWKYEVWERGLDQHWCCDGRECGCRGETIRSVWEYSIKKAAGEG